jgi:hypothetical protein
VGAFLVRVFSRGFLTASQSSARVSKWSFRLDNEDVIDNPDALPDWTYFRNLNIEATLLSNLNEMSLTSGISDKTCISGVIVWACAKTGLRGSSPLVVLNDGETKLQLEIEPGLLRQDLQLDAQVILNRDLRPDPNSPLAARSEGSILWISTFSVALEGLGARMPFEYVSFRALAGSSAPNILWKVELDTRDLNAPADASLRILLNSDHPNVVSLNETIESEESEKTLPPRFFLSLDIYRQIVLAALFQAEDFSLDEEYSVASVGALLKRNVLSIGSDLELLRSRFRDDPATFDLDIQSAFGGISLARAK